MSNLLDKLDAQKTAANAEATSTSAALAQHANALRQQLADDAASLISSASAHNAQISAVLSANNDSLLTQIATATKDIERSLSLWPNYARMISYALSASLIVLSLGVSGLMLGWSWWKAGSIASATLSAQVQLAELTRQVASEEQNRLSEMTLLSRIGAKVFETSDRASAPNSSSGSTIYLIAPKSADMTTTYMCQSNGQTADQSCYRLR